MTGEDSGRCLSRCGRWERRQLRAERSPGFAARKMLNARRAEPLVVPAATCVRLPWADSAVLQPRPALRRPASRRLHTARGSCGVNAAGSFSPSWPCCCLVSSEQSPCPCSQALWSLRAGRRLWFLKFQLHKSGIGL